MKTLIRCCILQYLTYFLTVCLLFRIKRTHFLNTSYGWFPLIILNLTTCCQALKTLIWCGIYLVLRCLSIVLIGKQCFSCTPVFFTESSYNLELKRALSNSEGHDWVLYMTVLNFDLHCFPIVLNLNDVLPV